MTGRVSLKIQRTDDIRSPLTSVDRKHEVKIRKRKFLKKKKPLYLSSGMRNKNATTPLLAPTFTLQFCLGYTAGLQPAARQAVSRGPWKQL